MPSKEVIKLIGNLGIDYIIKTLKETLKKHKELFGDSSLSNYGMSPRQRFFDIQERVVLDVKALIEERPEGTHFNDYKQDYSIEVGEENFLLLKKHTPSDHKVRRLVKTGWYYNPKN